MLILPLTKKQYMYEKIRIFRIFSFIKKIIYAMLIFYVIQLS